MPDEVPLQPATSRRRPDGTAWDYEPARFEVARHLELLRAAGSANPVSVEHFEREIELAPAAQELRLHGRDEVVAHARHGPRPAGHPTENHKYDLETDAGPRAVEGASVEFIPKNGGGAGVRLRKGTL